MLGDKLVGISIRWVALGRGYWGEGDGAMEK